MTESPDRPDDSWYQDQWEDLMDLLSVSEPQAVVPRMRTLQTALSHSNFSRFEDALQAMESMEAQLDDLYTEKASTARAAAEDEHDQDTYEQLQFLLAREDKLQRALGVRSPDAVVEMVEGLTDQLDVLYAERDADAPPSPDAFLDGSNSQSERTQAELDASDPDAVLAMVRRLSEQLDALSADREQLAAHGIDDLDRTLELIDRMEDQLVDLYAERRRHTVDDPLLPPHTLHRLDDMDDDALDAVPAGALRVDDDGIIQRANRAALQWPGFSADRADALAGRPFDDRAAPGSDTALFRRFPQDDTPANTCFLYTYAGADTTTTLLVQLYRPQDASGDWILFRPT